MPIESIRTDGFDHAAKFMTEDQRLLHQHIAHAGIFVGVQITAANAGFRDANERLTRPGRSGGRYRLCWLMRNCLFSNPLEVGITRDNSLTCLSFKRRMQSRRYEPFGINQQSLM